MQMCACYDNFLCIFLFKDSTVDQALQSMTAQNIR